MTTHLVIPDCQVKPGNNVSFLRRIGQFIVDKKPDVIVQIGDFADMPSLSSYDVGKKSFEGRRYKDDIEASHIAMSALLGPVRELEQKNKVQKKKPYRPRMILTLGNHEERINRVVESDARLEGTISISDLQYHKYGWEVVPYLVPIIVDGIAYSHYFTSGVMGRAVTSARMLTIKKHMSCTMGHTQHWDICRETRADGKAILGLFSGSCYEHDEDYLGPQGNNYDRGVWMKYEVEDGFYYPHFISLDYLEQKYG